MAQALNHPGRDLWFTIDQNNIVTSASLPSARALPNARGRNIFDVFPEAQPIYQGFYDRAWEDGASEIVAFYAGTVAYSTAVRAGELLRIDWEPLLTLDVTSIDSLLATVAQMRRLLARPLALPEGDAVPPRARRLSLVAS